MPPKRKKPQGVEIGMGGETVKLQYVPKKQEQPQ
jgi:hypothetical protein